MSDELELRQLADAYGIVIDLGDGEAFAEMFAEGGELVAYWGRGSEPLARFSTPAALRGLVDATAAAAIATFHVVANHRCKVSGDRATADAYCVARHLMDDGEGGRVVEVVNVHYSDVCVRTSGGWRYAERHATRLWAERIEPVAEALRVDRAIAAALAG